MIRIWLEAKFKSRTYLVMIVFGVLSQLSRYKHLNPDLVFLIGHLPDRLEEAGVLLLLRLLLLLYCVHLRMSVIPSFAQLAVYFNSHC